MIWVRVRNMVRVTVTYLDHIGAPHVRQGLGVMYRAGTGEGGSLSLTLITLARPVSPVTMA